MGKYGLIGRKLSHSYSPQIHSLFEDYEYKLIEIEPDKLDEFFEKRDFDGINITIPYKVDCVKYCDELSDTARRIGSVNTIVKKKDGTLFGDNTDYFGFKYMVESSSVSASNKQCYVLGTGGASRSVVCALKDMGALRVCCVSRNGKLNYVNLYNHVDSDIIINATPVGMYPNNYESIINVPRFQRLQGVFDLIYNPTRSKLVVDTLRESTFATGGLKMLVGQAARSSELFTGRKIDDAEIEKVYNKIYSQMNNILLIGMPGCGKTTVGKILAEKLNREVIDLDEEITRKTGRTPEKIIRRDGEKAFREIETEVLKEVSKLSGKVISCGGGVISPKDNRFIMKMNSTVVWIERDESLLATDGRPLSQIIGTHELYIYRQPLYIESSDYNFTNNGTPEECADKIIREIIY